MNEGAAELQGMIAEAQPAGVADAAQDRAGAVIESLELLGEAARARRIARHRRCEIERLMRPLGVVDLPPLIEAPLTRDKIGKVTPPDRLGCERAVKALVLALRLRMIGTTVAHRDAELHQPQLEARVAVLGMRRSPRRAVIHQH